MPTPLPTPPYTLRPIPDLSSEVLEKVDPWEAMEFFRIEALLRSHTIWEKYRRWNNLSPAERADPYNDPLSVEYHVESGWKVLEGTHHRYLRAHEPIEAGGPNVRFRIFSGALNLRRFLKIKKEELHDQFSWDQVGEQILEEDTRYLWVRLDAAYSHAKILRELEEELEARKPSVNAAASSFLPTKTSNGIFPDFPYHATRKPPIRDVQTWLNYFRCFDLRERGKTFGQVANDVYGDSNQRETAESGYKRVSKLIGYAERQEWPPPSRFSQ